MGGQHRGQRQYFFLYGPFWCGRNYQCPETTTKIRASEAKNGGYIPIIALTAQTMKGDKERFLEAGMDDFVSKPILSSNLFDAIERCMCTSSATIQHKPITPQSDQLIINDDSIAALKKLENGSSFTL